MAWAKCLTRNVLLHGAGCCSTEDSLCERVGPRDTLSCFFSALWLPRSQSLLVQEIQSAKDIDLTCFKTFPIKAATCLCPWIGLWILLPGLINPELLLLLKFPTTNNNEALFQPPHVPVGNRMLFHHHSKHCSVLQVGMDVALSLQEVCCVLLGTPGVSLDKFFPQQKKREFKLKYLKRLSDINNILSSGSTWKRRVSTGFPGVGSAVSFFGTFFPGIGYLHSQGSSTRRG